MPDPKEGFKFFQNRKCPFFPEDGNEQACHPKSDPETHNCLFCYCPLYELEPENCPKEANPKLTEEGVKDCSDCLFPHRPENHEKLLEILRKEELKRAKDRKQKEGDDEKT